MNDENENIDENENDHLMNFIKNSEEPVQKIELQNIDNFGDNKKVKVDYIETTADSQWKDIELKYLPYGKFYPVNTHISIRAAKTSEIQSFATTNEHNPYEVSLKLNELLSACIKITYSDGSYGTYKNIIDGDRNTLAIIISKATSANGVKVEKKVVCDNCNDKSEQSIEFIPANYEYVNENELIKDYFNHTSKTYDFPLEDGTIIKLAPPTIGLTESVNKYVFDKTVKSQSEGKLIQPNTTFMLAIQYMKAGQNVKYLSNEELEQEEYKFSLMNKDHFAFIYETIDYMDFGIKKVKCNCKTCGSEMSTPFRFPNGAKSLFIVQNAFNKFIRK